MGAILDLYELLGCGFKYTRMTIVIDNLLGSAITSNAMMKVGIALEKKLECFDSPSPLQIERIIIYP
jgi:hypothetical protein